MNIGEKIKNIRIAQGLTQEEVAQRCELTKGFISQVERDIASPSITSFIDILGALGISPSDFFEDREEKKVFKDEDFFEFVEEKKGYRINWLVPNSQKNLMEPTLLEVEPDGTTEIINPYDGEEFGFVLEGKLELVIGDEVYKVNKGDSFYFKAKESHFLKNPGKELLKVLWISSPPSF